MKTKLADLFMDKITGEVVAKYRDQRLTEVSNNTVRLELAFLCVVFEQSRKEWGLAMSNPIRQIRMPKPGKPRTRRLEAGEEEALLTACAASEAHYNKVGKYKWSSDYITALGGMTCRYKHYQKD